MVMEYRADSGLSAYHRSTDSFGKFHQLFLGAAAQHASSRDNDGPLRGDNPVRGSGYFPRGFADTRVDAIDRRAVKGRVKIGGFRLHVHRETENGGPFVAGFQHGIKSLAHFAPELF